MTNGLSVSSIVNVDVQMSPVAAQERNFGSLLILGDSSVIDVTERLRLYTGIDAIATDFGTSSPEYLAASLYFSQSPQPDLCYVGRWARTATRATLRGAVLSTAQSALSVFTAINNGGMTITVDGVAKNLTALNFSAQTNLNGVAAVVQTALGASGTCTWDAVNSRFMVKSAATGTLSTITFAVAPGSGQDVSVIMGLRSTSSGAYVVDGMDLETLLAGVQVLADKSNDWYGLVVASSVAPTDDDYIAAAGYIEAGIARVFGVTTQDAATLDSTSTTDLAYRLKVLGYKRTFAQYSSSSPYAAVSALGRAFTVNFDGSNTTITLKFKQEPGVAYETLTATQAANLAAKNCNVFVRYNNDTAILQEGVMSNGYFFDEVHGLDWLQDDIQTGVYNLMYTGTTKIKQTDPGVNALLAKVSESCERGVGNGLIAPGVWNGPNIGALKTGDTLSAGYYISAPKVSTQSQADREARKAPVIQAAIKLAGAIHFVDVLVNVNR